MVDGAFDGCEPDIDWGHLLDDVPDDLNFDLCDLPAADGLSTSPISGCSLSIDDIERYFMEDAGPNHEERGQDILADGFFSDVIVDLSPGSDRSKESSGSPESVVEGETGEEEEKEKDKPDDWGADALQAKQSTDDVDNDPLAKKHKRQMRNRDAAVRSRERKKMYVKDLEVKSKYYEAECKRLGIMLQCCLAENQALRLSLHTNKAFDASMTKQESAVLLLESLLLGSLFGFLDIILCLLLLTVEARLLGKDVGSPERESVATPRNKPPNRLVGLFCSFMIGKTCKASRSRMKLRAMPTLSKVG